LYNSTITSSALGLSAVAGTAAATKAGTSVLGVQLSHPAASVKLAAAEVLTHASKGPSATLQLIVATLTLIFACLAVAKIVPRLIPRRG
jgi:hypothetical protein